MNAKPSVPRRSYVVNAACAAFATACALGSLGALTTLFKSRGAPLAEIVAAHRTCEERPFVSEREACMRNYLAGVHRPMVAER